MNRVKATGAQLGFLEDYMKTHPKIAAGYVGRSYERRLELEHKWKQLASTLNSIGGAKKSVSKWRQTWRDLRSNTKRRYLNNRIELQRDIIDIKPLPVVPVSNEGVDEWRRSEETNERGGADSDDKVLYNRVELQSDSIDIKPLPILPISNEGGDTDSGGSCNDMEDEGHTQNRENFDTRLLKIEEEKIILKKKKLELKEERNRIEESRNATLNRVTDVLEKILNSLNK